VESSCLQIVNKLEQLTQGRLLVVVVCFCRNRLVHTTHRWHDGLGIYGQLKWYRMSKSIACACLRFLLPYSRGIYCACYIYASGVCVWLYKLCCKLSLSHTHKMPLRYVYKCHENCSPLCWDKLLDIRGSGILGHDITGCLRCFKDL